MPISTGDYHGLRKIARPYLSNGKTILEVGPGDNTGPFYALYPLVRPNGLYICVDTLYYEEMFKEKIIEDFQTAVNSGLVDRTFSPHDVNLRYLSTFARNEKLPSFDLAFANELIGFLVSPEKIIPILENLSRKKNPNARLILFEPVYSNDSSDLYLAKIKDKSLREVCRQFLDSIEEGRTPKGYEYIIGKL